LAIVSIVTAGVVSMSFDVAERRLLYNTSLKLQADLRYAQRRAIIEGHDFGITFIPSGNYYIIYSSSSGSAQRTIKTVELPGEVKFEGQTLMGVNFLPRGTISEGFTIVLCTKNYTQEITATVGGGRIRIYDMSEN
jgi:Tfp pilus assembly protein FimT